MGDREALVLDQGGGEAEGHGGVVGRGAGGEVEVVVKSEVGDFGEAVAVVEFGGAAEGVGDGDAEEGGVDGGRCGHCGGESVGSEDGGESKHIGASREEGVMVAECEMRISARIANKCNADPDIMQEVNIGRSSFTGAGADESVPVIYSFERYIIILTRSHRCKPPSGCPSSKFEYPKALGKHS